MVKTKQNWGSLAKGCEHGFQRGNGFTACVELVASTTVYVFALKFCGSRSRRYNMLLIAKTEEVGLRVIGRD